MALTDEELQAIVETLSGDECKQLLESLQARVNEGSAKPKSVSSWNTGCCEKCGSINIKRNGRAINGKQRFRCKDCGTSWTDNSGSSLKYSHLNDLTWKEMLRGFVEELSIPKIAQNIGCSTKTVWLAKNKVNQAIMDLYGYRDIFRGHTQADEYYTRASFKGKRAPEFFIYTLKRMPRHHYTRQEKIDWLISAGLYDKLKNERPAFLKELLDGKPKKKRGISNEQVCILTLVDNTGKLYLEPVSVGRLEKAIVKEKLKPRFVYDRNNVLVTDDHNAYGRALYGTGAKHKVVKADKHANGKYNLARVNAVHNALSSYMDSSRGKVFNTKYMDLTLILFWWLQKNKGLTTQEKVRKLWDIMTGNITTEDRTKVNQTRQTDLMDREITMDTKGQFPKKL